MKDNIKYSELTGKTIANISLVKNIGYDDSGTLHIEFTDKTECLIVADYGDYTGNSRDEYPRKIHVIKVEEN